MTTLIKENSTDQITSSTNVKKKLSGEKMTKSESVHEPAYMREYGRITEYPNPDEKLKGWKETGYKIVTEVEYVDKDAKQDKAFEARDKGKAEHTKKLLGKTNYHGVSKGHSEHEVSHHDEHTHSVNHDDHSSDTSPPPPPPPPSTYEEHGYIPNHQEHPAVTYETDDEPKHVYQDAASSNNNKKSLKLKPENDTVTLNGKKIYFYGIPKSPVIHVDPPASVTYMNYQTSASKQIPSIASPNATFSPGEKSESISPPQPVQLKSNQAPTESTFVTIIANSTTSSHDSAPATTTDSTSIVSTYAPEASFRPLRKPPSPLINALHIIDSPSIRMNTSESKTVQTIVETTTVPIVTTEKTYNNTISNSYNSSYPNHHKFSKLVSIEAPPSVYLDVLNRMKEAKLKAEKEAKEKKEREKMAWLSRIVKANSYSTQPQLNPYLPYASSSNGYGQYTLPNPVSSTNNNKASNLSPYKSLALSSANKGSSALPLSSSSNDPMDTLASLLGASSSSSSVSNIMKNFSSFSPLSSFGSNGLYPFSSGLNNGPKIKSPLTRLASTLNPRKIIPSVREYTKSFTQPLSNVFSPFASSSNIRNTILPLSANGKNRLFPVAGDSDATMNSLLNLLMTHGKRMDSPTDEMMNAFQSLSETEREKKTSSLLESTFESLVKDYPPLTSSSDIDESTSETKTIVKSKLLKGPDRRQDSDEEDELANTSVASFIANNLNDGPDQMVDWIPHNNLKNLDPQNSDDLYYKPKTNYFIDEKKSVKENDLKNEKKLLDQRSDLLLPSSGQGDKMNDNYFDRTSSLTSGQLQKNDFIPKSGIITAPVASFDQWMKYQRRIQTAFDPLKPPSVAIAPREKRTSISLFSSPQQKSLMKHLVETSTSQPVYLKDFITASSLADAIKQSKWIAKSPIRTYFSQ